MQTCGTLVAEYLLTLAGCVAGTCAVLVVHSLCNSWDDGGVSVLIDTAGTKTHTQ